jgi:hypothetical protein
MLFVEFKGGIGAVLGALGCPLPFAYVHAIYWVVQVSLVVLALETGTTLAVYNQRKINGTMFVLSVIIVLTTLSSR